MFNNNCATNMTMPVAPIDYGGYGGYGNNGMFGDGGWWSIIILLALFGGFGRGGFGGFGGFNGNFGGACATQADVREAVDQQTLISKLDQQTYGLADTFTALNNSINSNFRGVDNAICNLGFQTQQGFNNASAQLAQCCCDIQRDVERNTTQGVMNTNAIQSQIASCCCDLEKANMQNRFDAQAYNCNTLQAIDKLGDRIIDHLNAEKTQALRDENQALRLAASQSKQNQFLINELRPSPIPAYQVANPYCCYGYNNYNGFGYNNGCGCNSGCC